MAAHLIRCLSDPNVTVDQANATWCIVLNQILNKSQLSSGAMVLSIYLALL